MLSRKWTGFRSVVCPVDFSNHSRQALAYAEAIASRSHARLTIQYANDPLLVAAAAAALHDRRIVKRSLHELQAFAGANLRSPHPNSLRLQFRASTGRPADEILKLAAANRADLIVVGTHGLTGADRLLMGSTTLSVLQKTTVPVLAVPLTDHGAVAPVASSWPGEQIVAAVPLDDQARAQVDAAARIAQWSGASLLLLHVVSTPGIPSWMPIGLSAHERIRVAQAHQLLDGLAGSVRKRVTTSTRVVCGRIADEIAALAASERIQLVVTGLGDRRGWFGSERGSVPYHVLTHAVTPVLALPPQWRPR
jgi:nucleotide-binding universal stress UspA family protein